MQEKIKGNTTSDDHVRTFMTELGIFAAKMILLVSQISLYEPQIKSVPPAKPLILTRVMNVIKNPMFESYQKHVNGPLGVGTCN